MGSLSLRKEDRNRVLVWFCIMCVRGQDDLWTLKLGSLSTMLLTMLHRKVPHDMVKRPLYPLLFHVNVSNYTAKMLLMKAKTRPFCSRKLAPFCLKIFRKRDCLRGRLGITHTVKILTTVASSAV